MTTLEKRQKLHEFCDMHRTCENCLLSGPVYRCGQGTHFLSKNSSDMFEMSDKEIVDAYKIVFGEDPQEVELLETNEGIFIHVSGADISKIHDLVIHLKED